MLDHLPREILFEIFSRLPLKSLGLFKRVCKTWLSLISDPMMQQKLQSRGPRVLLSSSAGLQSLDCSKPSFTDEAAIVNLVLPLRKPREVIAVVGSCNGLICLSLSGCKSFILWNPSTGVYKKLPDPDFQHMHFYGFAYDSSIDDYKILCATLSGGPRNTYRILATKTDSWREIGNTLYDFHCWQGGRGSLLNGNLHWLAKRRCSHGSYNAICAFNLAEEIFFEVPMPSAGSAEVENFTVLSVLSGCLCLIYSSESPDGGVELELWMMREYGVQSTWGKVFRIFEDCNQINYKSWLAPVCFTTTAEFILINNSNELIRCSPNERKLESLMISRNTTATAYVESLVSPNVRK